MGGKTNSIKNGFLALKSLHCSSAFCVILEIVNKKPNLYSVPWQIQLCVRHKHQRLTCCPAQSQSHIWTTKLTLLHICIAVPAIHPLQKWPENINWEKNFSYIFTGQPSFSLEDENRSPRKMAQGRLGAYISAKVFFSITSWYQIILLWSNSVVTMPYCTVQQSGLLFLINPTHKRTLDQ